MKISCKCHTAPLRDSQRQIYIQNSNRDFDGNTNYINRFCMERFAYVLRRLKNVKSSCYVTVFADENTNIHNTN